MCEASEAGVGGFKELVKHNMMACLEMSKLFQPDGKNALQQHDQILVANNLTFTQ